MGGPGKYGAGVLLLCFFALAALPAQLPNQDAEGTSSDTQFWFDYKLTYQLRKNSQLKGEVGFRTMFPDEWYRGLAGMEYRWTPRRIHDRLANRQIFDITPGLRYFFTYNMAANDMHEIRLFQDIRVSWPTRPRFRLVHRLRFEERFEDGIDSDVYEFSARMRYRIETLLQLRGHFLENFYIPLSLEAFFTLEDGLQFNDVFRARTGIGVFLGDYWRLEGLPAYHNVNNSVAGIQKTHDLVFQLRVLYDLN